LRSKTPLFLSSGSRMRLKSPATIQGLANKGPRASNYARNKGVKE
jgi:hypothetical protein